MKNYSNVREWQKLNQQIIKCDRCPRLIKYCQNIAKEKRKSYQNQEYWGRPVEHFGAASAKFLIVGLAPAAHGANRTGRMFTGDRSGLWLYRALYENGFSNQADSVSQNDGLILKDTLITAVTHCAPPENKPSPQEIKNCQSYLSQCFNKLPWQVTLALGAIAWSAGLKELQALGYDIKKNKINSKFAHAKCLKLPDQRLLIASYHPSQQNTFTGRLTQEMFDQVFKIAQAHLNISKAQMARLP